VTPSSTLASTAASEILLLDMIHRHRPLPLTYALKSGMYPSPLQRSRPQYRQATNIGLDVIHVGYHRDFPPRKTVQMSNGTFFSYRRCREAGERLPDFSGGGKGGWGLDDQGGGDHTWQLAVGEGDCRGGAVGA